MKTTIRVMEMFEVPTWQRLRKAIENITTATKQFTKEQNVMIAEGKIEIAYNKYVQEVEDATRLEEFSKLYNFDVIKACEKLARQKELYEEMWEVDKEINRCAESMELYENQHCRYDASIARELWYKNLAKFESLKREFIENKEHA